MLQYPGLALTLVFISSLGPPQTKASLRSFTFRSPTHSKTPTALQVVERFIQATGGRTAWMKVESQYAAGTIEVLATDNKGTFEAYTKAPNQSLVVMKFAHGGEFKIGFDGQRSWSQTQQNGARYDPPEKQAASKRDADFYKYLHFKEHFPNAKVTGIEEVEGAKAYVVEATPAGEELPERLYFNVHTGLLVLRDTSHEDSDGKKVPDMLYYDDYREVDGIKVAFSLRIVQGNITVMTKQTEVKNNFAMDDLIFNLPASK